MVRGSRLFMEPRTLVDLPVDALIQPSRCNFISSLQEKNQFVQCVQTDVARNVPEATLNRVSQLKGPYTSPE